MELHFDGLEQDCSIPIANALEILQFSTNPSICDALVLHHYNDFQWDLRRI